MFETGNYLEAGLWAVIGLVFLVFSFARTGTRRSQCVVAAATFVLFGVSDIVEVHTGAWWRPWWLLAWKGGCILAMLRLFVRYRRDRRAEDGSDSLT